VRMASKDLVKREKEYKREEDPESNQDITFKKTARRRSWTKKPLRRELYLTRGGNNAKKGENRERPETQHNQGSGKVTEKEKGRPSRKRCAWKKQRDAPQNRNIRGDVKSGTKEKTVPKKE